MLKDVQVRIPSGCAIAEGIAKEGVLTGFILIGQVERAGIYTSLIREKCRLIRSISMF